MLTPEGQGGNAAARVHSRLIDAYLRARCARSFYFGDVPLGDTAWDILLDLYLAEHDGRRVSVSGACIASGAPSSTAVRWIAKLEEAAIIERQADPYDGRRFWLNLSPEAKANLKEWLVQYAGYLASARSSRSCRNA